MSINNEDEFARLTAQAQAWQHDTDQHLAQSTPPRMWDEPCEVAS